MGRGIPVLSIVGGPFVSGLYPLSLPIISGVASQFAITSSITLALVGFGGLVSPRDNVVCLSRQEARCQVLPCFLRTVSGLRATFD